VSAFPLRRRTAAADELELGRAHADVVRPRRVEIAWDAFDRSAYPSDLLLLAAEDWRERARTEYHSLAAFTQLASQLHLLGAPLDWAGAFVRMTGDEVRHAELCARMAETLGSPEPAAIAQGELHLVQRAPTLRAHVRETIVAAFCIGETLSGRMFRRCLRAATVPLARDVVRAIVDDETFHGQLGWELGALMLRDGGADFASEREELARGLFALFEHYRRVSCADPGEAWAREGPEAQPDPNFGTLTRAGYARAFYDGMREDVVPGLVAIGLPEAEEAWEKLIGG
jgi:hypothetical protein